MEPEETVDERGYTSMVNMVTEGNLGKLSDALEQEPDAIHLACDWHGDRLLALACWAQNFDVVKKLIELKADLNAINESNSTALHRASFKGDLQIVELLLDSGADYNLRDRVRFFIL